MLDQKVLKVHTIYLIKGTFYNFKRIYCFVFFKKKVFFIKCPIRIIRILSTLSWMTSAWPPSDWPEVGVILLVNCPLLFLVLLAALNHALLAWHVMIGRIARHFCQSSRFFLGAQFFGKTVLFTTRVTDWFICLVLGKLWLVFFVFSSFTLIGRFY